MLLYASKKDTEDTGAIQFSIYPNIKVKFEFVNYIKPPYRFFKDEAAF